MDIGVSLPPLVGDPEVVRSAEQCRARIVVRVAQVVRTARRPDIHDGTRQHLLRHARQWQAHLAKVKIAVVWDGADSLPIATEWETVDNLLKQNIADYEVVEEWLGTKGINNPLKALVDWRGYTPTECLAWSERFQDREDADSWRDLGWQPNHVAALQESIWQQAHERHAEDSTAGFAYECSTLESWRTSGMTRTRPALYARLGISVDEAREHEAAGRDDLEESLVTLIGLRSDGSLSP